MKVLHVIGSFRFGGIEKVVGDLIKIQLTDLSAEPSLLVTFNKGEFHELYHSLGIKIFDAQLKNGRDLSPFKISRIFRTIRNYDIIHLHGFNTAVALACFFSRKNIVYTEHGVFGFGIRKKWSEKLIFPFQKFFIQKRVNTLVFNSLFTQNYAKTYYNLKYQKSEVVYNGVNLNFKSILNETKWIVPELKDNFVIGTFGRLAGVKRIDRLLDAFSIIKQPDLVMIIVGDGILHEDLKEKAKKLGIFDKVIFVGYKENVFDYELLVNVCVIPSSNEAFGLVAVECLGLGKPTIVFKDGGGLVEIIEAIEPENIVGSVEELALRLDYFIKNKEKIPLNNENRIKRARFFSVEKMSDGYKQVYFKLINK
jgi:L-malate glycosyltransferase